MNQTVSDDMHNRYIKEKGKIKISVLTQQNVRRASFSTQTY